MERRGQYRLGLGAGGQVLEERGRLATRQVRGGNDLHMALAIPSLDGEADTLFLAAEIIVFHSRANGDDSFVGALTPKRENVFVPTTFDLRRDNPALLWWCGPPVSTPQTNARSSL
jgi:hypothetical protein